MVVQEGVVEVVHQGLILTPRLILTPSLRLTHMSSLRLTLTRRPTLHHHLTLQFTLEEATLVTTIPVMEPLIGAQEV